MNDGNNNGQATHGTQKHAWRTQAIWANFFVSTSKVQSYNFMNFYSIKSLAIFIQRFMALLNYHLLKTLPEPLQTPQNMAAGDLVELKRRN